MEGAWEPPPTEAAPWRHASLLSRQQGTVAVRGPRLGASGGARGAARCSSSKACHLISGRSSRTLPKNDPPTRPTERTAE